MLTSRKLRRTEESPGDGIRRSSDDDEKLDPRDWDELGDWLNHDWRELRANGVRYAGAYIDLARLKSTRAAASMIVGGLIAFVAATTCVAAVIYGVRGMADVLQELYGGRRWAGDLSVCVLLLGAVLCGGRLVARKILASVERDVKERYEIRQAEEAERARDDRRRTDGDSK